MQSSIRCGGGIGRLYGQMQERKPKGAYGDTRKTGLRPAMQGANPCPHLINYQKGGETMNMALQKYRTNPKGVLTNMYSKHVARSRAKGFDLPTYSLKELHERFLNDEKYLKIYRNWIDGGCKYYDKPSIDRINPDLGYSMDNIEIMTWRENRTKGDLENAVRFTTPVLVFDLNGNLVGQYESVKSAAKEMGLSQGLISMCCMGKRNHTGGYVFKYRGDKFGKRKPKED